MTISVSPRSRNFRIAFLTRQRRHALVVLQLALASYRREFVRALEATDEDIVFLVGDRHFGEAVVTDVSSRMVQRTPPNIYLAGRRAAWQRGCLLPGFLARRLVIELNPRNLTSWLLLISRILTLRGAAGWGQAHSRRGPKPGYNRARRLMQRMCSELITYTDTEANELRRCFPTKTILPACNSLYSMEQMSDFPVTPLSSRPDLILIGRLVPEKKPLLGIQAFERARAELPSDVVLHIVGAGPADQDVRDYVAAQCLVEQVRFHGWVSELNELARIFGRCRGLVAPGYIGLNATQALVFGVVVLYPRDDPHSPEVEALDTTNSIVFDTDDVEGCSRAILSLYHGDRVFEPHEFARCARLQYSTDRMIEPFVQLAKSA